MTQRDKNNWRGGRRSQRAVQQEAASEKSWKRSRSPAAAGKGRRRPWLKLILTLLTMLTFVVVGWWIFQPVNQLRTHFVMLDLLADSTNSQNASTEFFDPVKAPAIPQLGKSRRPLGVITGGRPSSLKFAEAADTDLNAAQVVVVYLQTHLLTTGAGTIQCLGKSSTPDLKDNQSESLVVLKEQLRILTEGQKRVLLIVDEVDGLTAWRLGDFRDDAAEEILSWPSSEDFRNRLVVVSSYSEPQLAGPASSTYKGCTHFGSVVANGLSQLGDTGNAVQSQENLDIAEFCEYVVSKSNANSHRQVRISPSLEQLRTGDRNFVVLGELPLAPKAVDAKQSKFSELNRLWKQRDKLGKKLAWRWRPMLWQSSTEFLLRAQQADLSGQIHITENLLGKADAKLAELAEATSQIFLDSAEPDNEFGIPQEWLQDAPNGDGNNNATTTFALTQNLDKYPFDELNLETPDTLITKAKDCRVAAERAANTALGVINLIPQTIRSAEQWTLLAEDRLFTSNLPQDHSKRIDDNHDLWKSIQKFSSAHQRAELLLQRTLSASESLAYWAATFDFEMDSDFEDNWSDLLARHLSTKAIRQDSLNDALSTATQLEMRKVAGIKQISVPLRSRIFRLLISSRVLQQQLHPVEPDSGFVADDLSKKGKELTAISSQCDAEWRAIEEGILTLCSESYLSRSNMPDAEVHSQLRRIRATLNITMLPPETRDQLMRRLLVLSEEAAEQPAEASASEANAVVLSSARQRALWYGQHLVLLANGGASTNTSGLHTAIDGLTAEGREPLAIARFGSEVRSFWKQARSVVTAARASTGSDIAESLRTGDLLSRGFSAFDEVECPLSVTSNLQTLWRVEHSLSHAERLLMGQWVLPTEAPPSGESRWYAATADDWLSNAKVLATGLNTASNSVPAFVDERLNELKDQKDAAAAWSISMSHATGIVDLRGNDVEAILPLALRFQSTPPRGIAALQFPTKPSESQVTVRGNSQPVELQAGSESIDVTFHRDGNPGTDGCDIANFQPAIFFRGRKFAGGTTVSANPCAAEEFVYRKTSRPKTASVKVFGDDVRPLAFVMDMSLSMKDPEAGPRKYDVALDRLRDTVKGLGKEHRASLRVFGHRVNNAGESNEKYKTFFGKDAKSSEDVTPQKDTVVEVTQRKMDNVGASQFLSVIEKLRKTEPSGITPLLRSIRDAIRDDLGNKPGIVVAITDGIATDAGIHNKTFQKHDDIPNLSGDLRRVIVANPATKVIVVTFSFQNQRERNALTKIMANSGITSGQIVNAENGSGLMDALRAAFDPIAFEVSESSLNASSFSGKADLGKTLEALPAGKIYQVNYADIEPATDLLAGPGDHFQLKVDWPTRKFEFVRDDKGGQFKKVEASRPADLQTPWILRSTTANLERTAGSDFGKLSLTLMLDHENSFQPVRQPKEIEFRFTSIEGYRAPDIEEKYSAASGAPGYQISIPQWPVNQYVRVDAAWKMKRTTPDYVLTYEELQQREKLAEKGTFLPCSVSPTLLENGHLQIRLDPIGPAPDRLSSPDSDNRVEDIRIEIGSRGELRSYASFRPDEVTHSIHRTEDGAVVFVFDGKYDVNKLAGKDIAFTSRASRLKDAIRPTFTEPMIIRPNESDSQP